ncbi:TM0106 family RecB-like putative nuclease [Corynebacterium sp. 13CS0277]|uniref:TM0106 family RecB-like putative nuclease n=1 Tax=Corynebacterium sp. 13CS0277 TaxID=2071994 RepID=UPI001E368812|nr:TM0106 family RecB-like putative nuclease [Corynebacterium sp. 13CS0277]
MCPPKPRAESPATCVPDRAADAAQTVGELVARDPGVEPHELVGCRYRLRQRAAHPDVAAAPSARLLRARAQAEEIRALLPTAPALGDSKQFSRVQATDEFDTLEALAAGHTLIENARIEVGAYAATVDVLVKTSQGYVPVIFSTHRVARAARGAATPMVATSRLGLGAPVVGEYRLRHHVGDGYRLAVAAMFLREVGLDTGTGGAIGQDPTRCFLVDTAPLVETFTQVESSPVPTLPRRTKECRTCRFWQFCEPILVARDDISLYLPGDAADRFRALGIDTVQALIDSEEYPSNRVARAWREGTRLLKKRGFTGTPSGQRAAGTPGGQRAGGTPATTARTMAEAVLVPQDLEIDIDMEAYLDHGAYLWGAFDGEEYVAFVDVGLADEAANFARFWHWLMGRIAAQQAAGGTVGVYCYSNHGENHWMMSSARRFGGQHTPDGLVCPTPEEVRHFLQSRVWMDVFSQVRASLVSPFGLGLKDVAAAAGFHYRQADLAGEGSVDAYLEAIDDPEIAARIVEYNEEDCRATRVVRQWLRAGAPGTEEL